MRSVWKSLCLTLAAFLAATSLASAGESRQFADPKVNGVHLDYCRVWAGECGQPAADQFCRGQGYVRATAFNIYNRGEREPTIIISNPAQQCSGGGCNAFRSIQCERPTQRVYADPKVNGVHLDYCRIWAGECGQPAADQFCRSQGLARASSWNIYNRGVREPTVIISNPAQQCSGGGCNAFSRIVCTD